MSGPTTVLLWLAIATAAIWSFVYLDRAQTRRAVFLRQMRDDYAWAKLRREVDRGRMDFDQPESSWNNGRVL
jgi:hypothetical protein